MITSVGSQQYWHALSMRRATSAQAATGSAAASAEAAAPVSEEEAAAQSLEEFKREFYQFIDSVPVHPSQAGAASSVSIHDKAFEKMMNDPDYKAEVEMLIRREFSADYSIAPPAFTTMRFDENGVYSGSAGGSAHMDKFASESGDAFWKKSGQGNDKDSAKEKAERKRKMRDDMDALLVRLAEQRKSQAEDARQRYLDRFQPGTVVKQHSTEAVSAFPGVAALGL